MNLNPLVNPLLQLQHVMHNPLGFLVALLSTLYANDFYIESMVGTLGWYNFLYKPIVYIIYFLAFAYVLKKITSTNKRIFPPYITLALFLICTAVYLSIFLILYLQFTPVGFSQILGVQGRYFLPLIPFVLIIIRELIISFDRKKTEKILACIFVLFVSIQSLSVVLQRYYIKDKGEDDSNTYLKLDPTSFNYMIINKPYRFNFELKDKLKDITGFQFYFTTLGQKTDVSYRYKFLNKSCINIIRQGDLDTKKLEKDALYQESFVGFVLADPNICLILEPTSVSSQNHYISLVTNDQSTVIKLIGNTE